MLYELQDYINASVDDMERLYTYQETINNLRAAAHYSLDWDVTDVFIWIYKCIDGFLPLLEAPTQEALAILAHFCVMLKKAETQWWLQGWTNCTMSEIYRRMDEEHKVWIYKPAEEIGWVPPRG